MRVYALESTRSHQQRCKAQQVVYIDLGHKNGCDAVSRQVAPTDHQLIRRSALGDSCIGEGDISNGSGSGDRVDHWLEWAEGGWTVLEGVLHDVGGCVARAVRFDDGKVSLLEVVVVARHGARGDRVFGVVDFRHEALVFAPDHVLDGRPVDIEPHAKVGHHFLCACANKRLPVGRVRLISDVGFGYTRLAETRNGGHGAAHTTEERHGVGPIGGSRVYHRSILETCRRSREEPEKDTDVVSCFTRGARNLTLAKA